MRRIPCASGQEEKQKPQTGLYIACMEPSTQAALTSEPPALFTCREACQLLRISKSTLYRLIGDGELVPAHIGRSVRFTRSELHRFVAGLDR